MTRKELCKLTQQELLLYIHKMSWEASLHENEAEQADWRSPHTSHGQRLIEIERAIFVLRRCKFKGAK